MARRFKLHVIFSVKGSPLLREKLAIRFVSPDGLRRRFAVACAEYKASLPVNFEGVADVDFYARFMPEWVSCVCSDVMQESGIMLPTTFDGKRLPKE